MPEHGRKYVRLRETAIVSLLAHSTIAEAAAASGISERGMRKWMSKPDFAEAVRSLRAAVLEAGASRLTGLISAAIGTLEEGLASRKSADRTSAARAILEFRERMSRDQLREKVETLERQIAELRCSMRGNVYVGPVMVSREAVSTIMQGKSHPDVSVDPSALQAFLNDTRPEPEPKRVIDHHPTTNGQVPART